MLVPNHGPASSSLVTAALKRRVFEQDGVQGLTAFGPTLATAGGLGSRLGDAVIGYALPD